MTVACHKLVSGCFYRTGGGPQLPCLGIPAWVRLDCHGRCFVSRITATGRT